MSLNSTRRWATPRRGARARLGRLPARQAPPMFATFVGGCSRALCGAARWAGAPVAGEADELGRGRRACPQADAARRSR